MVNNFVDGNNVKSITGIIPDNSGNGKYTITFAYNDEDGVPQTGAEREVELSRDVQGNLHSLRINGTDCPVSSSIYRDAQAYDDAFNDYTYKTYLYNLEMEKINASIAAVQGQDKTLELRLKQLDTERSAISTEMDSVKSVLKKNAEETFKTFA